MKFHLLHNLVEYIKRFGDISALVASVYVQFDVYIEKAYQWSSRMQATCIQKIVMLMER